VAPCVQRRNVWLTPTTRYLAVTLHQDAKRVEILQGCPKLQDRSQPLVGGSSPYYEDMWSTYCCLSTFFPIVDTCLSCEDTARQICAMVPRWRFLATFLRPVSSASRVQHVSDLRVKFALRPHHLCMYDRHSTLRRLRLGEETKKKEEQTTG